MFLLVLLVFGCTAFGTGEGRERGGEGYGREFACSGEEYVLECDWDDEVGFFPSDFALLKLH